MTRRSSLCAGVLVLLPLLTLLGCGGGGGGGSPVSFPEPALPDWTDHAVNKPVAVTLPDASPLVGRPLEASIFDRSFALDSTSILPVSVETATDVALLLEPDATTDAPVVYLFTTVLPGDTDIRISAQSTAIGLVMNAIPQYYLTEITDAANVRHIISVQAEPFITRFIAALEDDPYLLRIENLPAVYDQMYEDAVVDSYNALRLLAQNGARIAARDYPGGQFEVMPADEQDGFSVLPELVNGRLSGNILIHNDTRIYAHYQVLTTTGDVLKAFPQGFVNSAYDADILGSQSSFWGGFIATEKKVETGFRNVMVDIQTPGLLQQPADYLNSTAPGLLARSTFANFLLPVMETVLSISDAGKIAFAVMGDAGVFDEAVIQAWRAGDIRAGINSIAGNLDMPLLSKLIEKTVEKSLEDGRLAKMLAKLAVKLTAVEIMGSITAIDLAAFRNDLQNTHASLRFNVTFPITLEYLTPYVVAKESGDSTLISLYGHGFAIFDYEGVTYHPELRLVAFDKFANQVDSRLLGATELTVNGEGTRIDFYLPAAWLGQADSLIDNIDFVDLQLRHHYVQPGSVLNSLEFVELPASPEQQADYRIDLTSGLSISSLSKSRLQGLDTLEINGAGFHEEGAQNEVYLVIDRSGVLNPLTVDFVNIDATRLTVSLPGHEVLQLIGPASIYVELPDGSQSNRMPVTVIPQNVVASPPATAFENLLDVSLSAPQAFAYVLYSTDGGVTEQVYTAPLLLDATTTLVARARSVIDGIEYDSDESVFVYTRCADNQMAVDGECQRQCQRVCDNPIISNVVSVPGYALDVYGGNPMPHTLQLSFERSYKWCTTTIIDPEFYNGEKHMLYFYRMYQNPDGSWNDDYFQPDYGFRSFNFGQAAVDVVHDYMKISLFPKPLGYTQAIYYDPETFFGLIVVNYDNSDSANGNDYMEVRLGVEQNYYHTIINPEMVEADGCYEGDF